MMLAIILIKALMSIENCETLTSFCRPKPNGTENIARYAETTIGRYGNSPNRTTVSLKNSNSPAFGEVPFGHGVVQRPREGKATVTRKADRHVGINSLFQKFYSLVIAAGPHHNALIVCH